MFDVESCQQWGGSEIYIRISPLFWSVFLPRTPTKRNRKDARQLGCSCLMTCTSLFSSQGKGLFLPPQGEMSRTACISRLGLTVKSSDPDSLGLAFDL